MSSTDVEGLKIVSRTSEGAARLLFLAGELDFATTGPLRARLRALGDPPVVLDLSGLTFTDSTGLALLLEERARTGLRIRGATGQTRELLERTGVLGLFERPNLD